MRTVSRPTETVPTNLRAETFLHAILNLARMCRLFETRSLALLACRGVLPGFNRCRFRANRSFNALVGWYSSGGNNLMRRDSVEV